MSYRLLLSCYRAYRDLHLVCYFAMSRTRVRRYIPESIRSAWHQVTRNFSDFSLETESAIISVLQVATINPAIISVICNYSFTPIMWNFCWSSIHYYFLPNDSAQLYKFFNLQKISFRKFHLRLMPCQILTRLCLLINRKFSQLLPQ